MSYDILAVPLQSSPALMSGLGDLASDRQAGVVWLWNETRPFVAKFQFQDRIDVDDVNRLIADMANYIVSASGYNAPAVMDSAQAIFWNDLSPNTQSEWKKTATWAGHPTVTGYRLSAETINKAGTSIGESVSAFRSMVGGGGGGGGTEGGGGASDGGLQWSWITNAMKSPWALVGLGVAAFGALYFVKKRQIAGKRKRA